MPELPEVETARRRAERLLKGRRIVDVRAAADPLVFEGTSPRRFVAALQGRRVVAVRRRATPVKAVLLDQSLFAGVGNWMADEEIGRASCRERV